MSRIYAIMEDYRQKLLVELQCDYCGNKIRPNHDIKESGWEKHGSTGPGNTSSELDSCPDCSGVR